MRASEGRGFWVHAAGVEVNEFEGAPLERRLLGELVEADVVTGWRIWLRVRVARASRRSRKLEAGSPPSVRGFAS